MQYIHTNAHCYSLISSYCSLVTPSICRPKCGRRPVTPANRQKKSVPPEAAIINGVEARQNSWPWMSSLRYRANNHHLCGGSIIDRMWILTAAHCLHYRDSDVLLPVELVKVVVGDHVTTTVQPSEREYFPRRFLLHEDYNRGTLDSDIALIELTEAIQYNNDTITPVCLPTGPPPVGEICTTTGWGWTLRTGDRTHLNELHAPIISNAVCRSQRYWGNNITPNKVCAGYSRHGICRGDSGGPLVCNNNGNSPYSLVGVTSYVSRGCRNQDGRKPSVFTNVFSYLDWIQSTIYCVKGHSYRYENEMTEVEKIGRLLKLIMWLSKRKPGG